METIRTLIRGALPPVGRPIIYDAGRTATELPHFAGYDACWVDSGTSALALALLEAKHLRPEIAQPEVIVPGYCCPDLVAAAHYAGVKPIVVDINVDDPSLSLDALRGALSTNTLAIVAINFLGLAENLQQLLLLKREFPQLLLVEDNAQWFPSAHEQALLVGDFVTFSFGRGKPVSLLGGGVLLAKQALGIDFLVQRRAPRASSSVSSRMLLRCKYLAYNQLLSPIWYQLLSRNPFIRVGVTQYHALPHINVLDAQRAALLPANIQAFLQTNTLLAQQYRQLFDVIGFQNQLACLDSKRCRSLLRYPVLFKTPAHKQRVFARLSALGLGATEMYKTDLPHVANVGELAVHGVLDNSAAFASRFISLPMHAGVSAAHLQLIAEAFSD